MPAAWRSVRPPTRGRAATRSSARFRARVYRSAVYCFAFNSRVRSASSARCCSHAAIGSGRSSRQRRAMAAHRRGTRSASAASGNTRAAHDSAAAATTPSSSGCAKSARETVGPRARSPAAARPPDRRARPSADRDRWRRSTAPRARLRRAAPARRAATPRTRSNESRGACSSRAASTASSPHSVSTRRAPARYADAVIFAHERRRLERHAAVGDRPDDQEPLSRLQVEADGDGEIGIGAEHLLEVGRHRWWIVREDV